MAREAVTTVRAEVWTATALLHREQPDRAAFRATEIRDRVAMERLTPVLRPGVYVHAIQHCVANRVAAPARYRLLYATSRSHRRLFRTGDTYDASREGGMTVPDLRDLPEAYRYLLDWYASSYDVVDGSSSRPDPLLALRGLGKKIWGGEDPDDYVRRLREGW